MFEVRYYLINRDGHEVQQAISKEQYLYLNKYCKPEQDPDFIRWVSPWIEMRDQNDESIDTEDR